jgi:hypothetical protein
VSSLVRLLNRIKLHRDVFGVYSKVDIRYYSQNGKIEQLHLKNAILLNETYQRQFALRMQSAPLRNSAGRLRHSRGSHRYGARQTSLSLANSSQRRDSMSNHPSPCWKPEDTAVLRTPPSVLNQ